MSTLAPHRPKSRTILNRSPLPTCELSSPGRGFTLWTLPFVFVEVTGPWDSDTGGERWLRLISQDCWISVLHRLTGFGYMEWETAIVFVHAVEGRERTWKDRDCLIIQGDRREELLTMRPGNLRPWYEANIDGNRNSFETLLDAIRPEPLSLPGDAFTIWIRPMHVTRRRDDDDIYTWLETATGLIGGEWPEGAMTVLWGLSALNCGRYEMSPPCEPFFLPVPITPPPSSEQTLFGELHETSMKWLWSLTDLTAFIESNWRGVRSPRTQAMLDTALELCGLVKVHCDDCDGPGYIVVTPEQAEAARAELNGRAAK